MMTTWSLCPTAGKLEVVNYAVVSNNDGSEEKNQLLNQALVDCKVNCWLYSTELTRLLHVLAYTHSHRMVCTPHICAHTRVYVPHTRTHTHTQHTPRRHTPRAHTHTDTHTLHHSHVDTQNVNLTYYLPHMTYHQQCVCGNVRHLIREVNHSQVNSWTEGGKCPPVQQLLIMCTSLKYFPYPGVSVGTHGGSCSCND